MKRTRIFFLLFAICLVLAACSVQKPETTTPVADTTTAEPGTTSVAEPATEPVPAALPEFQADGIVILPEGEWGLFRYYVNQDVEIAEIKTLADLFSGEPVVAAEESPGPWMNVRFTQTESEVASFFISRDNVIRYYDTKGNVCYIRLAVDKPLYDTVSGYYRQYAESPGADDDFALMEVYLRDKMLKFYEEGSTAVRLESCKEYASIEVGVDYTFRLYRAVMRVRPQRRNAIPAFCASPRGPSTHTSSPFLLTEKQIRLFVSKRISST